MTSVNCFEYQKTIILGLIDPENHGYKQGSLQTPPGDYSISTISSIASSVSSCGKRNRIYDQALCLTFGRFHSRLNISLHYWPSTTSMTSKGKNSLPCQLHRWAGGREARKQRMWFIVQNIM